MLVSGSTGLHNHLQGFWKGPLLFKHIKENKSKGIWNHSIWCVWFNVLNRMGIYATCVCACRRFEDLVEVKAWPYTKTSWSSVCCHLVLSVGMSVCVVLVSHSVGAWFNVCRLSPWVVALYASAHRKLLCDNMWPEIYTPNSKHWIPFGLCFLVSRWSIYCSWNLNWKARAAVANHTMIVQRSASRNIDCFTGASCD